MKFRLFAFGLAALLTAACVEVKADSTEIAKPVPPAPTAQPIMKGAMSGNKQLLRFYMTVEPDCTSIGYSKVIVVNPPENGEVFIEKGEAYPDFEKENIRARCNDRKIPAMMVYYKANDGFVGTDRVMLEAISATSSYSKLEYIINVR